ncbi:hypothetical protein BN871_AC_00510 [Paenibacillus sp. P22]|nr:hypothetical protein BN871_AC_00510 [Paenibacillus sp. P22]
MPHSQPSLIVEHGFELGHGQQQRQQEHDDAYRGGNAELVVLEGVVVEVVHQGHGSVVRSAARKQLDDHEDFQHGDDVDDGDVDGGGLHERQENMADDMQAARPVYFRGLEQILRDADHRGDVQDDRLPDVRGEGDEDDDRQHRAFVAEQIHRAHFHLPGHIRDEAVGRIQQEAPHHAHDDHGHHDGNVIAPPDERDILGVFVEDGGADEEGKGDRQQNDGDDENDRVPDRLEKDGVAEQSGVIVESDERFRPVLDLVQAEAQAFDNRIDDEDQEQQELRGDEQISGQAFFDIAIVPYHGCLPFSLGRNSRPQAGHPGCRMARSLPRDRLRA